MNHCLCESTDSKTLPIRIPINSKGVHMVSKRLPVHSRVGNICKIRIKDSLFHEWNDKQTRTTTIFCIRSMNSVMMSRFNHSPANDEC
jgi:hypothetical protein